ncbi:MAG: AbrB/MazE/SpoVT family DNA-binding domain-containing protein [Candidatus Gracilibacteria bacterium]|nr:AbrB/MazE/SpoVT family DNA-binding domain-containing protein [Candidatus Gracilibacteria bacterium]
MDSQKCSDLPQECDVKMYGSVTVGTKGQVVIPRDVRADLDIKPGDTLIVLTKHGKAIGMIKTDDMEVFMEYMKKEMGKG